MLRPIDLAVHRRILGYSFWTAPGWTVKCRVAGKALATMKEQVRLITRRTGGRSIAQVCEHLGSSLRGWKEYFRLADTPRVFAALDEWIRHRLRAIHLKHWKRGRTVYRELRARGIPGPSAAKVAAHVRSWWRNSGMPPVSTALPIRYFDQLGIPRLAA